MRAEKSDIHFKTVAGDTVPFIDFLNQLNAELSAVFHQFHELPVVEQVLDLVGHGNEDCFVQVLVVARLTLVDFSDAEEEAFSVPIGGTPVLEARVS